MRHLGVIPLLVLFVVPLGLSVALVAPSLFDRAALGDLTHHPQFWGALALTLFTGLISTALSLVLALLIVAKSSGGLTSRAGAFLSLPHLSFAIGLGFLIMPAGLMARIIAQGVGWTAPPAWVTTQDPHGWALTLALVLKETPFLVWVLSSLLQRDDLRQRFAQHRSVAASLGHGEASTFLRVIMPQLLPRIIWPLIAVLAYGLTVVDMALVIGPTQPPTLSQLVWTDLNDADPSINARGGAGVTVLSLMIVAIIAVSALISRMSMKSVRHFWSWHPGTGTSPTIRLRQGYGGWSPLARGEGTRSMRSLLPWKRWREAPDEVPVLWTLLLLIYLAVTSVLIIQSFAGLWPFPKLLPEQFALSAWSRLLSDGTPMLTSLVLAIATATLSLIAGIAWLETQPAKNDQWALMLAAFALCLPSLVIGLGQYRLFLVLGISGTMIAMFLAHVLPVAAYVLIMLQGPYRGFDQRYAAAARGLGIGQKRFLFTVKWPMLKAVLFSSFAVGFAVSMAQYVPAQLASAGRFSTLPMEAVTLTSGGNRALTAAYGLTLMALPLIVFVGAARFGRSRWNAR
jgi:putative thiamine transport system permease protein